ncbi:MAG: hypothetical protein GX299_05065 [Epulopiscium sp.]|jgi:hypothetical protein|nr:hypothetical protein [Candidatus Epulonipiscium sp.]
MPNYKEMYFELFNKITDVIIDLQEVQKKTEEMYLNSEEPQIIELKRGLDCEEKVEK